ncbi:MAG: hypothetical protein BBJ57_04310 [Desulfobacterales bacterium PC51MH44]|nr:MAG: hypothetical protein BBJ57_04310 [Desulfobacterales bacterium PC51MH44]
MPTGYPRSPKLQKGALIRLSEEFLGPIPNIIVFQYNPETLTRSLSPWRSRAQEGEGGEESESGEANTAQPFDPGETFNLTLEFDAADALEVPENNPVEVISGIADRIAALEMLLYPSEEEMQAGLQESEESSLGGGEEASGGAETSSEPVPRPRVPVVLFVWGPGRIVPVRLTSFQVEEQAYSPTLYPIRAEVTVGLRVLTEHSFRASNREVSGAEELAIAAYKYTRGQKETLARANIANITDSILGMLPF